jgi:GGDEF domain-containing protein
MIIDDAFALAVQGQVVKAAALARQGLEDAAAAQGPQARAQLQAAAEVFEALTDMTRGRYSQALQQVGPPLAVLETGPNRGDLAYALSCIGFVFGKLGDPQRGLAWVARAKALAQASGRTVEATRALSDEGCLHVMLDHHERGIAALTEAATLALRSAPRFGQAAVQANLAFAWLLHAQRLQRQGSLDAAAAAAGSAVAWADRAFDAAAWSAVLPTQAWARTVRARALLLQGRADEAQADLQQALVWAGGFAQVQVEVLHGLLALHRLRGQPDQARARLQSALALCEGEFYLPVRLALLEDAVQMEYEANAPQQALAWWLQHFQSLQQQYRSRQALPGAAVAPPDAALFSPPGRRADGDAAHVDWLDEHTALLNWRGLERVGQLAFAGPQALTVAVLRVDGAAVPLAVHDGVARLLAQAWQPGFVAGSGLGNSFLLLFPAMPAVAARALCDSLRADLAAPPPGVRATLSCGIATQRATHADLQALMAEALQALGAVIQAGGDRVMAAP